MRPIVARRPVISIAALRCPVHGAVRIVPLASVARVDFLPEVPPNAVEQARRFQRNRGLIQALVNSSLRLAGETSALKRAEQCNSVAACLAQEIGEAAEAKEGPRAVELGEHFRAMLEGGVASNLTTACRGMQPGTTAEQEMRRLGARAVQLAQPLQEQLQRAVREDGEMREDMQRALQAIFDGRSEVEKVIGKTLLQS
jgi:hypothetical protein